MVKCFSVAKRIIVATSAAFSRVPNTSPLTMHTRVPTGVDATDTMHAGLRKTVNPSVVSICIIGPLLLLVAVDHIYGLGCVDSDVYRLAVLAHAPVARRNAAHFHAAFDRRYFQHDGCDMTDVAAPMARRSTIGIYKSGPFTHEFFSPTFRVGFEIVSRVTARLTCSRALVVPPISSIW